jgi:hypothetical protein
VRRIGQFLPGRPVTGLDIGCAVGSHLAQAAADSPLPARLGGELGVVQLGVERACGQ